MKEYMVTIKNNTYNISVESVCDSTTTDAALMERCDSLDYSVASGYVLDAAKREYDYCLQRSEKLDNKVYILLTVLAFLFVLLCNIISKTGTMVFPQSIRQLMLVIIFYVILLLVAGLFLLVLINLALLLRGMDVARYDVAEAIGEANLTEQKPEYTAKFISVRYLVCTSQNSDKLQIRYRKFNFCVYAIIPIMIGLLILAFMQNWI